MEREGEHREREGKRGRERERKEEGRERGRGGKVISKGHLSTGWSKCG